MNQGPTLRGAGGAGHADLVLVNGNVLTVDDAFSRAQAIAVKGGRITAVGRDEQIEALVGPATRRIDLAGATLLPGLNDSHAHVEHAGLINYTVSFDGVTTIEEAIARIAQAAGRTPAGTWIHGRVWHPLTQLVEKRFPTSAELDRATTDHPVHLPIGHFVLANSRAMALSGITADMPDPENGRIWRNKDGAPNGIFEEAAENLILQAVPPWSRDTRKAQLLDAMAYFNRFGITSAVSGAVHPRDAALLREICDEGASTLRLSLMLSPTGELNPSMTLAEWADYFETLGPPADTGDPWLSHAAAKLQVDGGMTLKTAGTRAPYPDDPSYHGEFVVTQERLNALVGIAHRAGWRVGVHAVGDAAIDRVLDAFEYADRISPIADRRFIIIHASLMQPDQMLRARAMGVRADVQMPFLWTKTEMIRKHLGDAVADRALPMRQLVDLMGLDHLANGTDYPINPVNPFIGLYMMVTRRDAWGRVNGADQAITREGALRLYTRSGAYYTFSEAEKGALVPGMLADMVIVSHDPMTVEEEAIKDIAVLKTIVAGKIVYDAAA